MFVTTFCHYPELLATVDCWEPLWSLARRAGFRVLFVSQPKREHRGGVASWRRQTMPDLFRHGEVVPKGRTNEEEVKLLTAPPGVSAVQGSGR
jgi:hypothetical protein